MRDLVCQTVSDKTGHFESGSTNQRESLASMAVNTYTSKSRCGRGEFRNFGSVSKKDAHRCHEHRAVITLQGSWIMKEGIHPEYRDVVFQDTSTGVQVVIGSTIKTQKTVEFEGRTLPMVTVDISSASHPFFTGKQKFIDAAGRVEKFQRKYNWGKKDEAAAEQAPKE